MTRRLQAFILISICCLGLSSNMFAGEGGSVYSRYGLGDIRFFPSERGFGMGGTGLSVLSSNVIDYQNPAVWTRIARTRFSLSALYEGFSTSDANKSAYYSALNFNGTMIAIPIAPSSGIVFAAGLIPVTRVNYHIVQPVAQSGYNYNLTYDGDGGLSQAQFGLSATPMNNLHIGAKFTYFFGTIRYTTDQQFTSGGYSNAQLIREVQLGGSGGTFGIVYSGVGQLLDLSEQSALNIGGMISTSSRLTLNEDRYYQMATVRDTVSLPEGNVRFPVSYGLGISYGNPQWLFAADYHASNWDEFTVNGITSPDLQNSTRIGIGAEYTPKRDPGAPFTQRISYRFGMYSHQTAFRIRGKSIDELGFTAGFGIPIFADTRLNLGAEYSIRGTTDQQLQKDRILRISFTLSGSELWFVRPTED